LSTWIGFSPNALLREPPRIIGTAFWSVASFCGAVCTTTGVGGARRPPMEVWNQSQALDFIKLLSEKLRPRYHLALAGSVLLKGSSEKDLDIIVFPNSTQDQDKAFVAETLTAAGLVLRRDVATMHAGWLKRGLSDTKHVEVWEYEGKRVDFLYLA